MMADDGRASIGTRAGRLFPRLESFAVTLSIAQRPIPSIEFDIHTCCVFTSASPLAAIRVSAMLVLYETAMGFALFKLTDSAKLTDPNLHKEFETPERANGLCVRGIFPLPRPFRSHTHTV